MSALFGGPKVPQVPTVPKRSEIARKVRRTPLLKETEEMQKATKRTLLGA